MLMRIGLLLGAEPALAEQLVARFAQHPAARAEMIELGPTGDNPIGHYDLIVDRISPLVPVYRSYLRSMALTGTTVVPRPGRLGGQDKLFALGLAQQLGIAAARAVLLPQHSYPAYLDTARALTNLQFPFRFDQAAQYIGFPAELRATDGLPMAPIGVPSFEEMMRRFDDSGERVLMLQQRLAENGEQPARQLRVMRLGELGLVMERRDGCWRPAGDDLAGLAAELIEQAQRLSDALGYPINALDYSLAAGQTLMTDGHQPLVPLAEPMTAELREQVYAGLVEALVRAPDLG